MSDLFVGNADSPLGELTLYKKDARLIRLDFDESPLWLPAESAVRDESQFETEFEQLTEYFSGARRTFELEIQLSLPRAESFRTRAQLMLTEIPYGETATYGAFAAMVGSAKAARAIGTACATNPLPIVLPCHRVVAANNTLGGYSAGLWRKRYLIELESGFSS